jgi:hypothetical protein
MLSTTVNWIGKRKNCLRKGTDLSAVSISLSPTRKTLNASEQVLQPPSEKNAAWFLSRRKLKRGGTSK